MGQQTQTRILPAVATAPAGPNSTVGDPDSALPSVAARVVAFASILVGGLLGGVIGAKFVDLQCEGDCSVPSGLAMWAGSMVTAGGVAVVAVLTLRALGEWRSIRDKEAA